MATGAGGLSAVHGTENHAVLDEQSPVVSERKEPLTMQLVVRKDLLDAEGWGLGPLMGQTAHATAAVLHETRDRAETIEYLGDLHSMRKVVMQTPTSTTLEKLAASLSNADPPVPYHLWIEQPENLPTCLALAPNRKEKVIRKALDKAGCRLWK